MPSANAQDELDKRSQDALMKSVSARLREYLEIERRRVNEEIRKYPPPIAACDAQFNYLLEERVRIAQELDQLKALTPLPRKAYLERICEFIASSNYINGELERKLRTTVSTVMDRGA